ncbi:MAG: hypothetical protein K6F83_00205 [Clostridiales bacterium]|nr:hypothetical protein [Clostridiales bacterium]
MAVIWYKTMNSNLQDSLRKGKVPEKNVLELSEKIKAENKKNFKTLSVVMAIIFVMMGGYMTFVLASNSDLQDALLQWIISFLVIYAIIFIGTYLAVGGIMKIQFNGAVREGYPELYSKCKV